MDQRPDAPPSRPRRPLSGGRAVAAAVAAGLVLLAGGAVLALRAGGSGPSPAASGEAGSESGASTQEDAALEYARCMREHGLDDFPDPVIESDGGMTFDNVDEQWASPGFGAAEEACQPIMQQAGPTPTAEGQQPLTPGELADLEDQWLGVAQCVRDQGYDYPDPELDEFGNTRGVQTDDAAFADAINGCIADAGLAGDTDP